MTDKNYRGDFSFGSKWDDMLNSMKRARKALMGLPVETRPSAVGHAIGVLGTSIAYAETHTNEEYVQRICAPEPDDNK